MSSIAATELRCMICPKQPYFSDQSHLLTHISSKGHLSHYFKAQVRASKDAAVRQNLRAYDDWYRKNNIEKLLSMRLETKESKQKQKLHQKGNARPPGPEKAFLNKDGYEGTPCPQAPQAKLFAAEYSCIDPNLERIEPCQIVTSDEQCLSIQSYGHHLEGQWLAPVANMHQPASSNCRARDTGDITPQKEFEATQGLFDLKYAGSFLWHNGSSNIPMSSNGYDRFYTGDADAVLSAPGSASLASHSRHTSITSSNVEHEGCSDFHRLKGTIWPGMDLFDTANEESKRRRNQKKDKAALNQLAEDAGAIEPTEVIYFYPSWEVKKSRFISGNVESSPIRETTPIARVYGKEARRPLEELDFNIPTKERKTRGRKPSRKKTSTARTRKSKRPAPEFEDENLDLMQPFPSLKGGRKRAFKVYEDGSPRPNLESPRHEHVPAQHHTILQHPCVEASPVPSLLSKDRPPTIRSYPPRGPGVVAGVLYNTPRPSARFDLEKYPPFSPQAHPHPGPDAYDLNLPQIITPQRVFLRSPARYGAPNHDSGFGSGLCTPNPYLHGTNISPLGFSLSALLAYNREASPKCSPEKALHQRLSPSERAGKAKQDNDLLNGSSGDETLDLGVGSGGDTHFFT